MGKTGIGQDGKGIHIDVKSGWGVEDTRWQMSYKKSTTTISRKSNPAEEKQ